MSDTPRVDAVTALERFYADEELIDLARELERALDTAQQETERLREEIMRLRDRDSAYDFR